MAQDFTSTSVIATTNVFGDNQSQRGNENTLRSTFSGSTQPSDPVVGQQWYDTANYKTWQYNGTTWVAIDTNSTTQVDVSNAKGNLTSLTNYLRVAHNDDGTLKTSPSTAIDEFKDNALVITYVSTNSFTVPTDLTSIFTVNRKLKVYLSASTAITYVSSSSYNSGTNVTTVVTGGSVLDSSVTSVKFSIVQYGERQDTMHTGDVILSSSITNIPTGNITSTDQQGVNNEIDARIGSSPTFRNRIINGDGLIDQRNNYMSITPTQTAYFIDCWKLSCTQASKITVGQNIDNLTPPDGFISYFGAKVAAATTLAASDYFGLEQPIEGLNVIDLNFGKSTAKNVVLSFWVYVSVAGNYSGALQNNGYTRSYPFSFNIPNANTWTKISVSIPGDTAGTWLKNNGIGISVWFCIGSGSNFLGTANAWTGVNIHGVAGTQSILGTAGNVFYVTGVQLEEGKVPTQFEKRNFSIELLKCKYFFEPFSMITQQFVNNPSSVAVFPVMVPTKKRTTPSIVTTYQNGINTGLPSITNITDGSFTLQTLADTQATTSCVRVIQWNGYADAGL